MEAFEAVTIATLKLFDGKFVEAEPFFSYAIKLKPTEPFYWSQRGFCCFFQRKYEKAKKYFLKSIWLSQGPLSPDPFCGMGMIMFYEGRIEEADEYITKSLVCNGFDPMVLKWKARILLKKGKEDEAQMYFKESEFYWTQPLGRASANRHVSYLQPEDKRD